MATRDVEKFFRDRLWTLIEERLTNDEDPATGVKVNNRAKTSDVDFDSLMAKQALAAADCPCLSITAKSANVAAILKTIGASTVPIPIKVEAEIVMVCASQQDGKTGVACQVDAALMLNPDLGLPTFVKSMTFRRSDAMKGNRLFIRWSVPIDAEFWPAELTT